VIDIARDFERMRDYTAGRLSDEEARAFEDRLVRDPELVRELEHSLRLSEGLRRLRQEGQVAAPRPWIRGFRVWLPLLAAAGIAGVALVMRTPSTLQAPSVLVSSVESRPGGASSPVTAHFTFVRMRDDSTPVLELPERGLVELRAQPAERTTDSRYRVALSQQDENGSSRTVGALAGVGLSADGYVHSYADAARLVPGSYVLTVGPDAGTSGSTENFAFRLRAP
jgi:hypothetical protein